MHLVYLIIGIIVQNLIYASQNHVLTFKKFNISLKLNINSHIYIKCDK